MAGTQVTFSAFDPTKKSGWLSADFNGFLYTWMGTAGIGFILSLCTIGFVRMNQFVQNMDWCYGQWAPLMITIASMIPAFIIVFVLRYNFTVIGEQRQIRYVGRWL